MPSVGKLEPSEVIVSVDGRPVRTPADLRRLIRGRKPGDSVRLGVRNSSGLRTVELRTRNEDGHPVIGVIIDQSANIKLPFPVRIRAGSVVGPSAGLAFALEIMEKLGHNVDRGYKVAATGELQLDGSVLPIGGVEQKTIEAKRSACGHPVGPGWGQRGRGSEVRGGMRVVPVNTFQQALHKLATVPAKA